ncbi:hypothetical protein DEJ50_27230 [Streptomyces venezuelae]|uniref:Uncharacterized protein n=1 Tax=Streptomyces venezuelae TaxID=54571 RepID=A0A5P2DCJ4_STRVZ|nr:hypothetical protein DEJ50_27230 [Streptomyces venezuelae]
MAVTASVYGVVLVRWWRGRRDEHRRTDRARRSRPAWVPAAALALVLFWMFAFVSVLSSSPGSTAEWAAAAVTLLALGALLASRDVAEALHRRTAARGLYAGPDDRPGETA